jgi:hypothetical protein
MLGIVYSTRVHPSLLVYKHGFIFLDQLGFAGPRWLLAMLFVVAPLAGRPAGCCHRRDCSIFLGDVYSLNGTVVVGALLVLLGLGVFSSAFGFGLFS